MTLSQFVYSRPVFQTQNPGIGDAQIAQSRDLGIENADCNPYTQHVAAAVVINTDAQTHADRARYPVCNNRPHLLLLSIAQAYDAA